MPLYLPVAVVVHLGMMGLARAEPFADGILQHSNVRVGIGVVVSTIIVVGLRFEG